MTKIDKNNHWESYQDVVLGFQTLIAPLQVLLSEQTGRIRLGTHGSVYDRATRDIETFLRLLWGMAPFLVENDHEQLNQAILQGLRNGTNPQHANYFGKTKDYDQLFVEMAAIAVTFLLVKEKTWDQFTKREQEQISTWLLQINHHKIPQNNWRFFRILVNVAMRKMGMDFSMEHIEKDFKIIDACYQENGWYGDGSTSQIDYYNAWAFHFYSCIYIKYMEKFDIQRCIVLRKRAILFAQNYQYWFDASGSGLPFGRSLTYRFAQSAFWSALVFADIEALPWGGYKTFIFSEHALLVPTKYFYHGRILKCWLWISKSKYGRRL